MPKHNALSAPHIHYHENTRTIMGDMVLTLLILYVMAVFYYGPRALLLAFVSVGTAIAADSLCTVFAGKRPNPRDLSALITGMIIPLMMPASIGLHIVVAAVLFGIVVAKHPFGGVGHNIFNPAAAGFAFTAICYGQTLFRYPMPAEWTSLDPAQWLTLATENTILYTSPSFTLNLGGVPGYNLVEMALGSFPGPMGATNILVILACLLYLIFRNTVRWKIPILYLVAAGAIAFLFPRANIAPLSNMLYELMSGTLLFGGVFMLGDPVTSPKRGWSQAGYGLVAGIVLMLFRYFGSMEGEFVFALLLLNASVWGFDMLGEWVASLIRGRKLEYIDSKKISKKA